MAFYIGDIPAEDIVIEPARNGEPIDTHTFDSLEVDLLDSSREQVPSAGFLGSFDDDGLVVIEWPGDSVLTTAGEYRLVVTLVSDVARERLAPVSIIVQDDDGWQTLDSARDDWADAPADDLRLFKLLELAKRQVIEFAPALDDDERPPMNYAEGQLLQARNTWNAARVDPSGVAGDGTFAIRPFPLDWSVKQILRPATPLGPVG